MLSARAAIGTSFLGAAGSGLNGSFHVVDFNLTGNDPFTNAPVPASRVGRRRRSANRGLRQSQRQGGFGSLQVTNMTRGTLAGYLDGTYGLAGDAIPQQAATSGR